MTFSPRRIARDAATSLHRRPLASRDSSSYHSATHPTIPAPRLLGRFEEAVEGVAVRLPPKHRRFFLPTENTVRCLAQMPG